MEFKYPIITRYVPPEYPKIPRPANAFMLYANHNRKKMAQMYPLESNKDISKRLGNSWKELESVEKVRYYDLAKQVDAEHKRKYPDYVYNPKEARIRKAMREASRERALGVTPMPSPRGSRRPNTWNFGEEEQLMMNPSHGMRGIIGTPMCSSPGFPIPTTGTGSFMQSMHYNKHMHPMSHASNGYMQAPPINQIPQQSEIWHPYEDSIRSAPTVPYMIPPQIQAYHPPPDIPPPSALPPEKPKLEPENFATSEDTHTNENVPPNIGAEKIPMNEPVFENKVDSIQPLIESGNTAQVLEPFMPTYSENIVQQPCRYDKHIDMKMKKNSVHPYGMARQGMNRNAQNIDNRYHKEYIRKYLENSEYETMEIVMDGNNLNNCFTYVTYPYPNLYNAMNQYNRMNDVNVNDICLLGKYNPICNDCGSEALNLSKKKVPETSNVCDN